MRVNPLITISVLLLCCKSVRLIRFVTVRVNPSITIGMLLCCKSMGLRRLAGVRVNPLIALSIIV